MKTSTKKFENLTFLVFLVQNLKNFSCFYFLADGQENVFDDVLERKHYENIDLQKSKNIFFQRD